MSKIYCWVNGGSAGLLRVLAMAEDGVVLAGHVSSDESWAKHDIGYAPVDGDNWKHDKYAAHYPDGFELEWVDDPNNHAGLDAAYALNQRAKAEATP